MPLPPDGRRAEDARATRAAITDSARRLFARHGYFATKVEDIARDAGVAPATVYAASGGKQGLITTLVEDWSTTPAVSQALDGVGRVASVEGVVDLAATAVRRIREDWGDVIDLVRATAPHDRGVARRVVVADRRYREAVRTCADRIVALHGGGDGREVADVLWFYLGPRGFVTLVADVGWDPDRAQRWLTLQTLACLRECLPPRASEG